ncbi:hypothetical protein CPB86DRAFT_790981 [Serendipita vermifera]|nr:hypothetical protein CPB86DRAFT_790981 [Serendipita vermifera]
MATSINPTEEIVTAAVQASQIADNTNAPRDIDDAITKWDQVVQMGMNYSDREYQAGFLVSYATALRKRWLLSHDPEDMKKEIMSLEDALGKVPQGADHRRYDVSIRLANAYQMWYQSSKTPQSLSLAIEKWEEAYGLSIILRCMKDAARDFLPNLANSLFISFKNGLSGVDSLEKVIEYYRIAIVHAPAQHQCQLRICLGRVYRESIEYLHTTANLQMAIECFETVIQNSQNMEEQLEALNEKSRCLLVELMTDRIKRVTERRAPYFFREWALNITRRHPRDAHAMYYYAISALWFNELKAEDSGWFEAAWILFQSKDQSPPDLFHFFYAAMIDRAKFGGMSRLPILKRGLEQFILFANTVTLKDAYLIQSIDIYPTWHISEQSWPGALEGDMWIRWKSETMDRLLGIYHRITQRIVNVLNEGLGCVHPYNPESDPIHFSGKSNVDLRAVLEARIVKPSNLA